LLVWDLQQRRPVAEQRCACSSCLVGYGAAAQLFLTCHTAASRSHSAEAGIISLQVLGSTCLLRCGSLRCQRVNRMQVCCILT